MTFETKYTSSAAARSVLANAEFRLAGWERPLTISERWRRTRDATEPKNSLCWGPEAQSRYRWPSGPSAVRTTWAQSTPGSAIVPDTIAPWVLGVAVAERVRSARDESPAILRGLGSPSFEPEAR